MVGWDELTISVPHCLFISSADNIQVSCVFGYTIDHLRPFLACSHATRSLLFLSVALYAPAFIELGA